MMFEVGKKYKGIYSDRVVTCVFLSDKEAVLEYENGRLGISPQDNSDSWKEYKEPVIRKHIKYVEHSRIDPGTICANRVPLFKNGQIGKIELTLTDGKLTDVRIVE